METEKIQQVERYEDTNVLNPNGIYASDYIDYGLKIYAFSTLESKLPHCMDGLLQLHRRILWSIKTDFELKQVAVRMGDVLSKYHPHGDSSISDGITMLAKPYKFAIPLLDREGSAGTYSNPRPAAPRYLDVCCSEFTKDIFFDDLVEPAMRLVKGVYQRDMEPLYFIPKIPTALLFGMFGIAMGFKSDTVQYNLSSICQLVADYVKLRKEIDFREKLPNLVRHLLPDTPCLTILRNADELLKEYRRGNFGAKIKMDGTIRITPSAIIITSFPDGIDASAKCEFLSKQLNEKDSFMAQYFQRVVSLSGKHTPVTQCHIECALKRGVDPFAILDQFKQVVGLSSSWTPQISFLDLNGKRCSYTPFEILETWYNERYRYLMAGIKYKQNRYIEEIQEFDAMMVVVENTDDIVNLFKTAESAKDTAKILCSKYGLTYYQASYIARYNLSQMTHMGKEEIIKARESKVEQLKAIQNQIFHVDDRIIEEALSVKKKYGPKAERKCLVPNFKGVLKIGENGYSQYFNDTDIQTALTLFGSADVQIIPYPSGVIHKYVLVQNKWMTDELWDLPKQMQAKMFIVSKRKLKYLVVVRDKTICYVDKLTQVDPEATSVPVGDEIWVFKNNMEYEIVKTTSLPLRKVATAAGNLTNITQVFDHSDDDVIAVHYNTKEMNTIRMARLNPRGGKIRALATGKVKIIGLFKANEPMLFTIPPEVLNRTSVRHIKIDDPSKLKDFEMFRVLDFQKIKGTDFYTLK